MKVGQVKDGHYISKMVCNIKMQSKALTNLSELIPYNLKPKMGKV